MAIKLSSMLLRTYLAQQQIPVARFASLIGQSTAVVYRYLSGERFPRPEVLERIASTTGGAVLPNDFHQFAAHAPGCPCEQRA